MSIIIERTITINNDQATLDKPIYFYIGDGNITCLFTIKEKEKAARFGTVGANNIIQDNDSLDYGEAKIYKPDQALVSTTRAEIYDNKLQVDFNWDNMDNPSEAGRHQLQIHLYDSNTGERNRLTIPPVDIHVLLPIGTETSLIDEAIVGYSLLNVTDEEVPAFDEEGNYNKTVWQKGDIITKNKLNKVEDGLYEINKRVSGDEVNDKVSAAIAESKAYTDNKVDNINLDNYVTVSELELCLSDKADNGHSHDDYALKEEIPTVPTSVSELENDAKYMTSNTIIRIEVVDADELPAPEQQIEGVLYIVKE